MRRCPAALIAVFLAALALLPRPVLADGTLTIAAPTFPGTVGNPYRAIGLPAILPIIASFDPVANIAADGSVEPFLAESWSQETPRRWIVRLREAPVFANGIPLTAEALLGSVAHMQTLEGRGETIGSNLANIEAIAAIDRHTVEIALGRPDPYLPVRLALWRIPEAGSWRQSSVADRPLTSAGTGPFRMIENAPGRVTFDRNPHAWNPPLADQLVLLEVPDQTARVQGLASGSLDIAMGLGLADRSRVERSGAQFMRRLTGRLPAIVFATEHPGMGWLRDKRIRQAFNYGVNKAAITEVLLEGAVTPLGQLAEPGAPGYDPELTPYPYDPEKARALLAEAGYPDGLDVVLRFAAAGPDDITIYQQVANDLRLAGIRVTLALTPVVEMTRNVWAGDMQGAAIFGTQPRAIDTIGDYRGRACLGFTGGHGAYHCEEARDAAYLEAMTAETPDAAAAAMRRVLRIEHDSPPAIFLWSGLVIDGVDATGPGVDDYAGYYDWLPLHGIVPAD